jgi:hypothetical protein
VARIGRLTLPLLLAVVACGKQEPGLLPAPRGGGVDSLTVALPAGFQGERPTASGKVITFVAGNPRDLLDGGVDALLTDDPALIDYAATRPRALAALALPWSRTYGVLAVVGLPVTDTAGFRDRMADAVSGAARGAGLPEWWREAARCPGSNNPPSASRAIISDRIVYRAGDQHAQEVAERLVALAARLRAVGLDEAGFDQAVASGNDFAYVVATPSRVAGDPCRGLTRLRLEPGHLARLLPLVETRWHLIVRRGRFGVSVDTEGTPRFH